MKLTPPIFASLLGGCFVALFWWGFAGFVASGSSGSPPSGRLLAFWIGGAGYLGLLLFSYGLGLTALSEPNRTFGAKAGKNLVWTIVFLLACFPAAFFFVGFIAPPFIMTGSAVTLLKDSIKSAGAADDD